MLNAICSATVDEGFHNVLSAICAKLGYYGVLINCVRCTV